MSNSSFFSSSGPTASATDSIESSRVAAANSAAAAATSATDAQGAKTDALAAQNAAESANAQASNQATAASGSASSAATSATNAAASATTASGHATNAGNSSTTATSQASAAATSATNAANSATAAASSATSASDSLESTNVSKAATIAAIDAFNNLYLGAKATVPNQDNDGNALQTGALYLNTANDVLYHYNGSGWNAAYTPGTDGLSPAQNLSDLTDTSQARANLELDPVRHSVRPSLLLDFANAQAIGNKVTFTRASTALHYDGVSQHVIEENMLTHSNTFTSGTDHWGISGLTVSNNTNETTAPDGTSTASKVTETSADGSHRLKADCANLRTGKTYTMSIYVKAFGGVTPTRYLSFRGMGVGANHPVFDLASGTVVSGSGTNTAWTNMAVENCQNGWYRCSATFVAANTDSPTYHTQDTNGHTNAFSFTGNTSAGMYLWGAQIEAGSVLTPLTTTTTKPRRELMSTLVSAANNVARIEHDPLTRECQGLRTEPSKTNVLLNSSGFITHVGDPRADKVMNYGIAPDGTKTAMKLREDATTNSHYLSFNTVFAASTTYTCSIYLKAMERSGARIQFYLGTSGIQYYVDLTNGTMYHQDSDEPGTVEHVGGGWYRCSITGTTASSGGPNFSVMLEDDPTTQNSSYTGNGHNGFLCWGPQVEEGQELTSYIATSGSAVTRAADDATVGGANFTSVYDDEFTLYVDGTLRTTWQSGLYPRLAEIGSSTANGGNDNRLTIQASQQTANTNANLRAILHNNGVSEANGVVSANLFQGHANTAAKVAVSVKDHDFKAKGTSAALVTDTDCDTNFHGSLDGIGIGKAFTHTNSNMSGVIRKLAIYPAALTSTEITDLVEE